MTGPSGRIAILGAGKMGEALLSGMLRAGRPAGDLLATARRRDRGHVLRERYGVEICTNAEAAAAATTLVIAVKPQDMSDLLDDLSGAVTTDNVVISMAAGITTGFIERRLVDGVPVVRVMSNTPVLVDEAMSAVSAGAHAKEDHLSLIHI